MGHYGNGMGFSISTATISASETCIGLKHELNATMYGTMFEKKQLGIRCNKATLHAQHLAEYRSTINAKGDNQHQQLQPLPTPPATKEPTFSQLANATLIPLPAMNTNDTMCLTTQLIMASVHAPIASPADNRQRVRKRKRNGYLIVDPITDGLDGLLLIFWDHQHRTP